MRGKWKRTRKRGDRRKEGVEKAEESNEKNKKKREKG